MPDFLERITIKGFKSIASIDLELRPINVLIGANGSGKSNFIEAFDFVRAVANSNLNDYVSRAGGAQRLLHFGSKTTAEITMRVSLPISEFVLRPTANDGLYVVGSAPSDAWQKAFEPAPHPDDPRPGEPLFKIRNRWRSYHFHDTSVFSSLRKTSKVDDNRFLRADGSNLPAFLYYLRERHDRSYEMIRATVARVAPFFQDFILEPLNLAPESIRLHWKHRKSDDFFDVSSLSDGTLRFIALTTLFLQPREQRPSLILVDEPELGLHPYAIGLVAAMIRQASVDSQVIVSTQSPLLLDYFQPEDVIVTECVDDATQLRRLDPARLAEWLEDYSLGQLWEKNEIGGLPGSI